MQLSVVVCTFNRYDELALCLDKLRSSEQTAAAKAYEVIVIDNTPPATRRPRRGFACDQWVVCDEIGLSHARNAGITAATGDIVAFIDDDAIPAGQWCEEIITVLDRHPDALAAGGRVEPRYAGGDPPDWMTPKLAEYLSCIDWGDAERRLRQGEWIAGVNMAFRRSVFAESKLFDPSLGRKGNLGLLSNEEVAIIHRIGHGRIVYNPRMLVRHIIPNERLTQAWFRKRVFWQAISDQLAGIDVPAIEGVWEEIRRLSARLPAEQRNLNGLCAKCGNGEEFLVQLRQVHLLAHLLASGMSAAG